MPFKAFSEYIYKCFEKQKVTELIWFGLMKDAVGKGFVAR